MGKRKKKQKQEDFKKVKLKVGKKLPKGANETQTSFKSQGIVVPSQDLVKEGQLTNARKQSLKDLLSHLNHYSATVRQDSLLGLRSLFQQHVHIFHENLSLVLSSVAEKMTDTDADVRQSLKLLLCFILPHLPSNQVTPFLPLLVAHLSCAMSHIYEDIQLESLSFLSLFLERFPNQITVNSKQLLGNFLGLISHHSGGTVKGKGNKIVTNPKGKLSSPKARLKILTQLCDFLKALYAQELVRPYCLDLMHSGKPTAIVSQEKLSFMPVFQENAKEPNINLLSFEGKNIDLNNFNFKESSDGSGISDVKEFAQKIIPLLLEFWVECHPSQLSTSLPENGLSPVNLSIMSTVMSIMKILFQALFCGEDKGSGLDSTRNWLASNYFKEFNKHFMKLFPIQGTLQSRTKTKSKVPVLSSDNFQVTLTLNISICEVMSCFVGMSLKSTKQPTQHVWMERLEEFVVETLEITSKDKVSADQLRCLLIYVEKVLQEVHSAEQSATAERLLSALFKLYQSSHMLSAMKSTLLRFFASLFLRKQNPLFRKIPAVCQTPLNQWLCTLPKLLVQLKNASPEMTNVVLKVLSRLMQQNAAFVDTEELHKQLISFLNPESGTFCKLNKENQSSTIELLFSVPDIDNSLLQSLALCCHHQSVPVTTVQYMLQILHYRSSASCGFLNKTPAFSLSSYLSFLFSVGIGYSRKQLDNLHINEAEVLSSYQFVKDSAQIVSNEHNENNASEMKDLWKRHQDILQDVCMLFAQFPNANHLVILMSPAIEMILKERKVLPLTVADSLLWMCKCFFLLATTPEVSKDLDGNGNTGLSSPLLTGLAELCFACVLYSTKVDQIDIAELDVLHSLFDDVLQLLSAHPPLLETLLGVLLYRVKDFKHELSVTMTKLLQALSTRSNSLFYTDAVAQLVSSIMKRLQSEQILGQDFADLEYQNSLFLAEFNRRKVGNSEDL